MNDKPHEVCDPSFILGKSTTAADGLYFFQVSGGMVSAAASADDVNNLIDDIHEVAEV